MRREHKTKILLDVLGGVFEVERKNRSVLRGSACVLWHDDTPLPVGGSELFDRWNDGPCMDFAEFEADGALYFAGRFVFGQLSLQYTHDETGDSDRDVQIGIFAVDEGSIWVLADLLADPETGEEPDAARLPRACPSYADGRRENVDQWMLGNG